MTPTAEVLLSYLTGLAPVGDPVEPTAEHLKADLGYRQTDSLYRYFTELMHERRIRRLFRGQGGTLGVWVVLRRLEA